MYDIELIHEGNIKYLYIIFIVNYKKTYIEKAHSFLL